MSKALLLLCLSSPVLFAFDYFKEDINYWNDKQAPPAKTNPPPVSISPPKKKDSSFDWNKELSPDNKEFFKEGDYTPPAAFIEVARNPSDENIKNWLKLASLKNELKTRLEQRIAEYVRNNPSLPVQSKVALLTTKQRLGPDVAPESSRYRFRLYVDSTCPHCRHMLQTMEELQSRGFFVELRQVDDGPLTKLAPSFAIQKASPNEISKKDITSVPVLFVADLKNGSVYRMGGYQTLTDIFTALRNSKTQQ